MSIEVKRMTPIEVTQSQYRHIKSNFSGKIFTQANDGCFRIKAVSHRVAGLISQYLSKP